MHKGLVLLIILLLMVETKAQAMTSNRQSFNEVLIGETLNEFVWKMKPQGFKFVQKADGVVYQRGDFASSRNCYLAVSTSRQKDLVSQIKVSFPKCNYWPVELTMGRYFTTYLTDKGIIQLLIEPTCLKIYLLLIYKD